MKAHKILVVDDMPANIDILMETLKHDYKMVAALNGEQALRLARAKVPPDLILLDVMMPGMDGFDVCRRLKSDARCRDIPVIFLTGLNGDLGESKGLALGAVDYITKPFNPDLVKARVKNHLELKVYRDNLETLVDLKTRQLREANTKIKAVSLDTIQRLARAAEFKDEDTGTHIQRMTAYSEVLARKLGLPQKTQESILYAAAMHDIGKIGIPDKILLKPGPLTANEFEIMKQHTTIGGKILSSSDAAFIRLGQVIALTHHEKFNGRGYPRGLQGTAIPLVGCIVAVADVFDALTSRRPYKEPFPVSRAFEIIQKERGQHFHPEVTDAFFECEAEILGIKSTFADEAQSLLAQMAAQV